MPKKPLLPTWATKTTDALAVANTINGRLDEADLQPGDLAIIADEMADAFEFTEEEHVAFIRCALANHPDHAERLLA